MLPRGWDRRTIVLLTFALLFVIAQNLAQAQVVDLAGERIPMVELHGVARFHTGDDPHGKLGWASPNFDDSQWPLIHIDQPWDAQGFKSDSGFAWYRFQVVVPPGHSRLAIWNPNPFDSYEIFLDGQLVGKYGGMPPNQKMLLSSNYVPPIHRIPDELLPAGQAVEVALRIWHWPYWTSNPPGLLLPLSIGDARILDTQRELRIGDDLHAGSGTYLVFVAALLGFCAGLGLFLLRPGEYEYLWFAGVQLSTCTYSWNNAWVVAHPLGFHAHFVGWALSNLVYYTCWPTFVVTFLSEPRRRLYWTVMAVGIAAVLPYFPLLFQWIPLSATLALSFPLTLMLMAGYLILIWIPARRGNLDARLLLAPQVLFFCGYSSFGVLAVLTTTGHYALAASWQRWYDSVLTWPFPFSFGSLSDFVTQVAVLAIVILRFARKSRDEERYKNELEAARVVQQVLVPAESPSIPGFVFEAVYKPAGQVGGDFFQILPTPNKGALIVIGDVSGKGMPAAMAVSLLVGTVRTLAESLDRPRDILGRMNQRMLGRSKDGFTTCMILRIEPGGSATVANAGHLAPYLGAQELSIESGLPLGLSAEAVYIESSFNLDPDQELTLLTDGVAEARAKTGELFGFERTASISTLSAEHIASTAVAFGQQDDITVLKIRRCLVPAPAGIPLAAAPSTSAA
jgi:hypothetical protein